LIELSITAKLDLCVLGNRQQAQGKEC